MRPLEPGIAEMKRLFVRPEWQGTGAGRALAVAVMEKARQCGYRRLRLDTLPQMDRAIGLYRSLGFREIPAYNSPSDMETIYFESILDNT